LRCQPEGEPHPPNPNPNLSATAEPTYKVHRNITSSKTTIKIGPTAKQKYYTIYLGSLHIWTAKHPNNVTPY